MTVKEFVEKYTKANDIEKNKLMKEINIKTYIPYAEKVVHSETVLNQSAHRVGGMLQSKSALRFLLFASSIIKLYTDIEINKISPNEDYDLLKESGAIDEIMNRIGLDIEEFTTVFNMTWDDMLYNENNWRAFFAIQLNSFMKNVEAFANNEELRKNIMNLDVFKS